MKWDLIIPFIWPSSLLLDCDLNNGQIMFNNASTAGFDNTRNIALNHALLQQQKKTKYLSSFIGRLQNTTHVLIVAKIKNVLCCK
jgi:hypothetical protein